MKIEIKHWITGSILFDGDFSSLAEAVMAAVRSRANLAGAYLARANLEGANLARANLAGANLARANLAGANLAGAYLEGANLADAYLAGAYLARANLAGAYLEGANLEGAYLARANLENYAQVSFKSHGMFGRMLTGFIQAKDEAIKFQCGCFSGDEKELRGYIANGEPEYAKSRTLALETVLNLLAAKE